MSPGSRESRHLEFSEYESADNSSKSEDGTKPQGYCYFLDLTIFKVFPCKADSNSHNLKRCPYYHD